MLILALLFGILYGLNKAGIQVPYYDNVKYIIKTKLAEIKFNKIDKTNIKPINYTIYHKLKTNPPYNYKVPVNVKSYTQYLKI